MKKKNSLLCLCALVLGMLATSCEEDYTSTPPVFQDMTFEMEDGSEVLKAGKRIIATAVQEQRGNNLDYTVYKWWSNASEYSHTNNSPREVAYDNQPGNPTDTLIFEKPGTYKVIFDGQYNISASEHIDMNGSKPISGGDISYRSSTLYYNIRISKTIEIR